MWEALKRRAKDLKAEDPKAEDPEAKDPEAKDPEAKDPEASYFLTLSSGDDEPMSVLIEPALALFEIPAGEELRAEVVGPDDEPLEITYAPGHVTLWPSPRTSIMVIEGRDG
ncbi:hypothetical protein [Aeromicrobium sp. NPDC092404]|uniref:hypothetical protein n=1 Tax=Aeromicrobium sp. NPDC092404 TaxID=3154976 RepID=UPI00341C0187